MNTMAYPLVRLRFLLSRNDSGVWGQEPTGDNDSIVLRSTEQTVDGQWALSAPAVRRLNSYERTAARLFVDDLLVTKTSGSSAHIGKTTIVNNEIAATGACFGNFMQRLRVGPRMLPRFLWYLMNLELVRNQFVYLSTTTTGLSNLSARDISQVEVPTPSLVEQRAIADYLDQETSQIDALVAKQEKFIRLLRERRAGLVANSVVGSTAREVINDNASWLGSPPAGWKRGRVKHFGTVTLGKMLQSNSSGNDILAPYMRAANVQPDGVLSLENVKSMWFNSRELRVLDLRAGDVVVVEGGIGGYGRAGFVAESLGGWGFQNSINRIRPRAGYDGRYLTYFLLMARQKGFIKAYCNIVSMPHLTSEKLEAMPMFLPPPDEQRRIADHLDEQLSRVDTLIEKAEEHITLAKERRAALITAAVTGQFDVRTARKAG